MTPVPIQPTRLLPGSAFAKDIDFPEMLVNEIAEVMLGGHPAAAKDRWQRLQGRHKIQRGSPPATAEFHDDRSQTAFAHCPGTRSTRLRRIACPPLAHCQLF